MLWPLWLLWCSPSLELSTFSSVQLFPQQQWQTRSHSTVKPTPNEPHMKLQPVRNATHCAAQDFVHTYELQLELEVSLQQHTNRFESTKAGDWATLRDLCLDGDGLPVRRLCNASAHWQQLEGVRCRPGSQLSRQLNQLEQRQLLAQHTQPNVLATLRTLLTQSADQLAAVDVYSTARIVAQLGEQAERDAALSADLVSVCGEIMSTDERVLRLSAQLNATNLLLSQFEDYMDALPQQLVPSESCGKLPASVAGASAESDVEAINYANLGVQALMSSDLSVFYVNPECANITGMAIYSSAAAGRKASGSGFWYRFLYADEHLEQLRLESQLDTATYLPQQLWQELRAGGASFLILKVYAHDGLFVETAQQRSWRPRSKVLSISIPGLEGVELPAPLPFLLPRGAEVDAGSGCGYWNYATWRSDGVSTTSDNDTQQQRTHVLCQAQHLTQFAFLVGGSLAQLSTLEQQHPLATHEQLLDTITQLGCGLSLCGLVGIFLTAALVPKWRSQASTKVLLHFCLALALQLLLFGWLGGESNGEGDAEGHRGWNRCLIRGAALQYSVLVIFSWMLIIAYLQFQRYVTVIGVARPQHYILLSAVIAWTLPLLPTLLLVLLDEQSYKPIGHRSALCYPSGLGLALGVVLPIALVTLANALMMSCIICSIHRVHNPRRHLLAQQLRLSVLLFFLLGLTWIFGLCSYLQLGLVFAYLFCLTATLQGFVLFVYFVLLHTANRRAWLQLICGQQMSLTAPQRPTDQDTMTTTLSNSLRRTESQLDSRVD